MVQDFILNLATLVPRSHANGPGSRMVVWVQGCPFRCPDCQNPESLDFRPNQIVTVEQIYQMFQSIPDLDGISFSGGEPFAQAVALAELACLVQSAGKTVVCWTGYRLDQIKTGKIQGSLKLLKHVDLLIDGLFMREEAGEHLLRGSANQNLYFTSGRIKQEDLEGVPRQEWIMGKETLTYTGFPISI